MKILIACYTVLAIAATARATVQLATKASEAPAAYALSALAAAVYVVLALSLRRGGSWHRVALIAAGIEFLGVVVVGAAELFGVTDWPDETVWSGFGIGYGLAPLVLPLLAIYLLTRRHEDGEASASAAPARIEQEA